MKEHLHAYAATACLNLSQPILVKVQLGTALWLNEDCSWGLSAVLYLEGLQSVRSGQEMQVQV